MYHHSISLSLTHTPRQTWITSYLLCQSVLTPSRLSSLYLFNWTCSTSNSVPVNSFPFAHRHFIHTTSTDLIHSQAPFRTCPERLHCISAQFHTLSAPSSLMNKVMKHLFDLATLMSFLLSHLFWESFSSHTAHGDCTGPQVPKINQYFLIWTEIMPTRLHNVLVLVRCWPCDAGILCKVAVSTWWSSVFS